ncbi:MAG: hypothetical protein ABMB14_19095 [Myxococcota bacterium]
MRFRWDPSRSEPARLDSRCLRLALVDRHRLHLLRLQRVSPALLRAVWGEISPELAAILRPAGLRRVRDLDHAVADWPDAVTILSRARIRCWFGGVVVRSGALFWVDAGSDGVQWVPVTELFVWARLLAVPVLDVLLDRWVDEVRMSASELRIARRIDRTFLARTLPALAPGLGPWLDRLIALVDAVGADVWSHPDLSWLLARDPDALDRLAEFERPRDAPAMSSGGPTLATVAPG